MNSIPEHILAQVHHLAADGLPVEQIAAMLRISEDDVQAELDRVNTTKTQSEESTSGE